MSATCNTGSAPRCRAGLRLFAAAILTLSTAATAFPADFTFSAALTADDDSKSYFFTLAQPGSVTLRTYSYGGGLAPNGTRVPAGGFDPTLSLFNSTGLLIASSQDAGCGNVSASVSADAGTGFCLDAYLPLQLPAGSYQLVVTQSVNVAAGPTLADAFAYTGQGSFTVGPESPGSTGFQDGAGNQRSPSYTLGLQGVTSSQAQLLISGQTPPSGKVAAAYTYQFPATGGTLPYTWTLTSGALPAGLTLSGAGLLSGTPTAFGTFDFTLQTSDSGSPVMSASQAFRIVVAAQDLQITTTALPVWVVSNAFSQNLALLGGYPPYTWAFQPGQSSAVAGLTLSSAGVLAGTPSATGALSVPLQVTDSRQNTVLRQFVWQVNPPLTVTSAGTLPAAITARAYQGFTFTTQGGASPPVWTVAAGSSLPSGISLSAAGALQGTPAKAGAYSFQIRATDSIQPAQQTVSFSVYDPLTVSTTALTGGIVGSAYGPVSLSATGGSGGYAWSAGLPAGLAVSAGGVIAGSPLAGGTFPVTVQLADAAAAQSAQATLQLTIAWQPLQISTSGNLGGAALGAGVSRSVTGSGGRLPYRWSLSGAPLWLSLDSVTGLLSGNAGQPGLFTFAVQLTDSQPVTTSVNVTLSVLGVVSSSLPNASTVSVYSQTLSAVGGTPPYTWSASGLPAGMSLSSGGTLGGTPRAAGTTTIAITVNDSAGVAASVGLPLTVVAPNLLTVSSSNLSNGVIGAVYSDALAASGGTAPYSWSIVGGSLPTGLSLATSGALSGTPTAAGTFAFTARAADTANAFASGSLKITVDPVPLKLTSSALPNGLAGSDYPAQIFTPAGGTPPYQFSVTAGNLPPGLAIAGGQITGTPSSAGSFSFTVSITDSATTPNTVTISPSITIQPAQADLILSSGAVSFSLVAPATALPGGANVTIRSSVVLQLLNYSVGVMPAAPWLDTTSAGTNTPGSLGISLNAAALALPASATPYQASVVVTCLSPSACAGRSQTVAVSLTVTALPPQLTLSSSLLIFSATTSNPNVSAQSFGIQNKGGGTLGIKSVSAADSWITLSGVPGTVPAGPAVNVSVGVSLAGLLPGFYRSSVSVVSSAGSDTVPVTLLYSRDGTMFLSPSGMQFQSQAGSAPGNPNGSFNVIPAGKPLIAWSAAVLSGSSWLKLGSPSGTASTGSPGKVNFTLDSASLPAGTYYDSVRISSPDVLDSPQDFTVVLNVSPLTAPVSPDPQPAGLLFLTSAGGSVPATQTVQIFAGSGTPIAYQASASTLDGGAWLSVRPPTGSTSATSTAQTTVSVTPGSMPVGVYRGSVSYALSSAAVRTVNVTLNIAPFDPKGTGAASSGFALNAVPAAGTPACTPSSLVPTQTGLVSNFAQPTAWPTPLSIRMVDNCGGAVTNGAVVATFSNGDSALPLRPTDGTSGVYSATWTPRGAAAQVSISARASAEGFPAAVTQINGQVSPNAAPILTPNATLHAFAPLVGGALGPGNIVQIYGQNLSGQPTLATTIPLPTKLGGTSVIIGGIPAPLYYASATQINAQVPFELSANKKYQIIVQANGALTTPDSLELGSVSPGIAAFAGGAIIAQHLDATLVLDTSPARPGEIIVFYLAGLGLTDSPIATGVGAPLDKLLRPQDAPVLTLNGNVVPVLFAGLTPGLVGLYQVNFQVPDNAPDGILPLVITQSGVKSNPTVLPVKR